MSLYVFTTQEKLAEVERMIEDVRHCDGPHSVRLDVLKALAKDLRGRLAPAPSVTLVELERKVVAAYRSKQIGYGFNDATLRGLAEDLIGHWATVKQALERFGAAGEIE